MKRWWAAYHHCLSHRLDQGGGPVSDHIATPAVDECTSRVYLLLQEPFESHSISLMALPKTNH